MVSAWPAASPGAHAHAAVPCLLLSQSVQMWRHSTTYCRDLLLPYRCPHAPLLSPHTPSPPPTLLQARGIVIQEVLPGREAAQQRSGAGQAQPAGAGAAAGAAAGAPTASAGSVKGPALASAAGAQQPTVAGQRGGAGPAVSCSEGAGLPPPWLAPQPAAAAAPSSQGTASRPAASSSEGTRGVRGGGQAAPAGVPAAAGAGDDFEPLAISYSPVRPPDAA